jgi:hypothetical protein
MSKKQTSIEYLWEQFAEILPFSVDTETGIKLYNAYQQAKAMHKEEIIEAYWFGSDGYPDKELIIKQAEQYYNETYGKE